MDTSSRFFINPEWKGCYLKQTFGRNGTPLCDNLHFHVVIVADQVNLHGDICNWVLVVPKHWVDTTSQYVLYPAPNFTLHGMPPKDWSEMIFNRRRYPTIHFVEYSVADFACDTTVTYEEAKQIYKDTVGNEETPVPVNAEFYDAEDNYDSVSASHSGHQHDAYNPSHHLSSPEVQSSRRLEVTGNDSFAGDRASYQETSSNLSFSPYYTPVTNWRETLNNNAQASTYTTLTPLQNSKSLPSNRMFSSTRSDSTSSFRDVAHQTPNEKIVPPNSLRGPRVVKKTIASSTRPPAVPGTSFEPLSTPRSILNSHSGIRPLDKPSGIHRQQSERPVSLRNQLDGSCASGSQSGLQTTNGRKRSEPVQELDFQRKMLKMVGTLVSLVEEQRNLKIVKERIVMENARYFQQLVSSNVKLPLKTPSEIEDLNNALVNIELSVALCSVLIVKMKSLSSRDQIAKMAISQVLEDSLCQKVTWRKRANDKRPMIGHLVNLIAVIGVVIRSVLEMNNQPEVSLKLLLSSIKTARRNISFETANRDADEDVVDVDGRADKLSQCEIDNRMDTLLSAIANFRPNK